MSLVLELQAEAIEGSVAVDQLLRKALAVATKLDLISFRGWVQLEMNGYSGTEVPEYRVMAGSLVCRNPYCRLIPFLMPGDPEIATKLSRRNEPRPIGVIEKVLSSEGSTLIYQFPPEIMAHLMRGQDLPMVPYLLLNKNAFVRIVDAVRNTVLDWALKLESEGILSEGMSFTPKEKQIAYAKEKELAHQMNIITIHNMHNSSIQQASHDAQQSESPRR